MIHNAARSARTFVLAATAIALLTLDACAGDAPQHVWLVSTRRAPGCGDLDSAGSNLRYCRLGPDGQWSSAEAAQFHATDDASLPTVVFIHGNRTDADEAVAKGWYARRLMEVDSGGKPFRYVIWSWPADLAYRRYRRDIPVKAVRSDVESYYLAGWLDHLRPEVKVSLVGHSFGPRVIVGALELLAGGEVAGRRLPHDTTVAWGEGKRNRVRAVLLAAAIDADALAPGGHYGRALAVADRVLVTRNECDRALRWYPRVCGSGGSEALGFIGPCGGAAEKVEVVDVAASVGRIHDLQDYCSAPEVESQWAAYTFLDQPR